jgi:asparagine synthase (glutamine-hydrolysing)
MIARQSRPHNRMLRMPCATRIYSLFGETMCGIVGIISENAIDPGLVRLMCGTIVHRGPDDEGIFTTRRLSSGGRESTVSLGHRRLSIIDISDAAHQPMTSSDGTCHIVYNGEVYNFLELRKELEQEGHKFRSNSDTEVVLYAYQHWGTDCIKRFNGMFALAIYDGQNDLLFLARDRAGKKPLYYSKLPGDFLFASEIKALLPYQGISRELDLQALNHYFTVGYIPGELCIFRDIRKLPPAHALTYRPGSKELKIWQYFSLSGEEPAPERDVEGLVEEARLLLADSVKRRLISDVPLGAFLSGGVDSSIVVAMMAEASAKPVKTFSIGFEESSFNELPYARIVAKHFATEHHEMVVTTEAMSILPELAKQYDEPFADSSLIPTYYVCRETRRHVTVALSGDGGDELFGGYKSYLATKLGSGFHRLFPNPVGAALCVPFAFLQIEKESSVDVRGSVRGLREEKLVRVLRPSAARAFVEPVRSGASRRQPASAGTNQIVSSKELHRGTHAARHAGRYAFVSAGRHTCEGRPGKHEGLLGGALSVSRPQDYRVFLPQGRAILEGQGFNEQVPAEKACAQVAPERVAD